MKILIKAPPYITFVPHPATLQFPSIARHEQNTPLCRANNKSTTKIQPPVSYFAFLIGRRWGWTHPRVRHPPPILETLCREIRELYPD
ncbi:hypothetical protein GWI33_013000 [Rhynchophorus ferrugineus]|uniref:Uncharacterized protein n=1 Tax=Rhynchophorus ferrugineus TaxID=354439 RepID=A0A834IAM6_RHYFE|nr:hypothetical protein GWI33_013000 [Rhynchophorus ferrugineus]